eukprot:CAMPEP_0198320112 /NCGR_PEP_ID=MMETSP1450-20131203/9111_1 /TAXON_ID=753684 ORGANISM="Madagascaria erythrocladiodes, Strain CCMP3234" /NCGR_SAMPLE_ID=MMETSP1450 /ASSEMBLY_ACC=CAM_ASM_001115 /LENGTH=49 /DNA_ID= /DNA_START= /DNA_END= /DNA_ORIENTATION=
MSPGLYTARAMLAQLSKRGERITMLGPWPLLHCARTTCAAAAATTTAAA